MNHRDQALFNLGRFDERNAEAQESARLAELRRPLPKIDDPQVRVQVLRPFRVRGRDGTMNEAEIGAIVTVPRSDALALQSNGIAHILK